MSEIKFPSQHDEDPERRRIGTWLVTQRIAYRNGTLSKSRIKKLEIFPGWSWEPLDDEWNQNNGKSIAFFKGNAKRPSAGGRDLEERQIGYWESDQRIAHKNSKLSPERIDILEQRSDWGWNPDDDEWNQNNEKSIAFFKTNKRRPSNGSTNSEERHIGVWECTQRQLYKKNLQYTLSQKRIDILEQRCDWGWNPLNDAWHSNNAKSTAFFQKNERRPSNCSKNSEERHIAHWESQQRQSHKENTLSQKRIDILEQRSEWSWNPLNDEWHSNNAKSTAFFKTNGRRPSHASKDPEERQIGGWEHNQRRRYETNKLSSERIDILKQRSDWGWNPLDDEWNQNNEKSIAFFKTNGRRPLSSNDDPEKKLASWEQAQRTAYKKNKLPQKRIDILNKRPDWNLGS